MPASHRALARLFALDGLALIGVAALAPVAHVGAPFAVTWWARATTSDLALALGWWAAAVLGVWVALSTLTCTVARVAPGWARFGALERLSLPVVRRAVDGALAYSMTVGVLAAPAGAATPSTTSTPPAVVQVMPDGRVLIVPATPTSATPRLSPAPAP